MKFYNKNILNGKGTVDVIYLVSILKKKFIIIYNKYLKINIK